MQSWIARLRCLDAGASFSFIILLAGCAGAASTGMAVPAAHSGVSALPLRFSELGRPRRLLYLAVFNASTSEVDVYRADIHLENPQPIRKITAGVTEPTGLWVDGAGTLYVVNTAVSANGNVVVYPKGSSKPSMTIPNIPNAHAVTVDAQGFVYVVGAGNFGGNSNPVKVFVFSPHSTKLVRTVTMPPAAEYDLPGTIALDTHGNVFTTQFLKVTSDFQICMAKQGAANGALYIDNAIGTSIAIDGANNLYIGDADELPPSKILVYAEGSKTPARTIVGGAGLSVSLDGTLYGGYADAGEFDEYAPGADSPTNSFHYAKYGLLGSAVTR